jgi:acetyltransferase-like isoleucine patch superfamily enzyme
MIASDVQLGEGVTIPQPGLVNLYGCSIGDYTKIGAFVEIQRGVRIGRNCKISSHSFVCTGVVIEDEVFVGHNVTFTNDKYPVALRSGRLSVQADEEVKPTLVKRGASIGSGATILCGLTIGEGSLVGAGSVVTNDVPPNTLVAGVPARVRRRRE